MPKKMTWNNTHIIDHKLHANQECNVRNKARLLVGCMKSNMTLQGIYPSTMFYFVYYFYPILLPHFKKFGIESKII